VRWRSPDSAWVRSRSSLRLISRARSAIFSSDATAYARIIEALVVVAPDADLRLRFCDHLEEHIQSAGVEPMVSDAILVSGMKILREAAASGALPSEEEPAN
jgi:hypothetical protein